ncbi:MAG: DegV family protein [Candidatus Dormibacteria bacterium]
MSTTLLVTDSGCDLADEWLAAHDVRLVPLSVNFGAQTFVDRRDIDAASFFERLAKADRPPTTSQPAPGDFLAVFNEAKEAGRDVLCLCMSARMSGTFQSATTAAGLSGADVMVEDSAGMSGLLGDQVMQAAAVLAGGGTREAARDEARRVRAHQELLFTVPDLIALRAGGRIGPAAAVLGGLLQIRPILTMREGEVAVFTRVRTNSRARQGIIDRLAAEVEAKGSRASVIAATANDPGLLDELSGLAAPYAQGEVLKLQIGPVVAAHTGSGTGGIIYRID